MLCNLLTTILRPNFEEPLDTAKQLVEKNITLYEEPGTEIWKQFLLESSIPEYRILGETYIVADDYDHFEKISEHDVMGAGTHARMTGYVGPSDLALGKWYRSKEKLAGDNPYAGYLTNKKWHLNEVLSLKQFVYPYYSFDNYLRKWQTIYYVFSKYEIFIIHINKFYLFWLC